MLLIDSASMALNSASLWLAFSPSDSALEKLAINTVFCVECYLIEAS